MTTDCVFEPAPLVEIAVCTGNVADPCVAVFCAVNGVTPGFCVVVPAVTRLPVGVAAKDVTLCPETPDGADVGKEAPELAAVCGDAAPDN